MKTLLAILVTVLTISTVHAQHFGREINEAKAIEANALPAKMGDKSEMQAKVSGTVESVCQAKGCWMKVKLDNGETMRVMFKDYAFFRAERYCR